MRESSGHRFLLGSRPQGPLRGTRAASGALGAEIHGLDLSRPISGDQQDALLAAFHRYGVLCIRDQKLTHDSQIALAKVFGEPDVHPIAKGMEEHPEVIEVRKPKGEQAFFVYSLRNGGRRG